MTSLSLTTPAARRLAAQNWRPLRHCTALQYIRIGPDALLNDANLVSLFRLLSLLRVRLRRLDITVDHPISQASVLSCACLFAPSLTHLQITVPWLRTLRNRPYPSQSNIHNSQHLTNLSNHLLHPLPLHPPAQFFHPLIPPNANIIPQDLFPLPSQHPFNFFNNQWQPAPTSTSSLGIHLTNRVLATIIATLPFLKHLVIDRARHITNNGILSLTACTNLEEFVLYGSHAINDPAMTTLLSTLKKLRILRLRDTVLIGDATIHALCSGPSASLLTFLELTRVGRVTDPAIKQLVNTCQNLQTVHIFDCAHISCQAASHLSCSLRLQHVLFKTQLRFPLLNRTSIHLSCASATLRSLQLMACKNLSLDGIVALANLPGLRLLQLKGLGYISQDVMRALGLFPKLHHLELHGSMHLTDLGVKVLCGQRGHRFLHLALIDHTRNLTDDALECIMTWCLSLRTLEVHGAFLPGAVDRLHEYIPHTTVCVSSISEGVQTRTGTGGLWDPILPDS